MLSSHSQSPLHGQAPRGISRPPIHPPHLTAPSANALGHTLPMAPPPPPSGSFPLASAQSQLFPARQESGDVPGPHQVSYIHLYMLEDAHISML